MMSWTCKFVVTSVFAVAASAAPAADRVPSEAVDFPLETAVLVAATSAFFDAVERAADKEAPHQAPVIGLPEVVEPASLQRTDPAVETLIDHGPVQHLTGYRINWYPVSRLLGTVDFMGTWNDNRGLICGYVSWDLTAPETPSLESVDVQFVDLAELSNASPERIHGALLEANCAFGEIDANLAFFEPVN